MLRWIRILTLAGLAAHGALAQAASSPLQRDTLETLARRYGFGEPLNIGGERVLRSKYSTVAFTVGSRKILFNDTVVWMNGPTEQAGNSWSVPRRDGEITLDPLLRPSATVGGSDITTIVIDPGHGGNDSGAIGHRHLYEKKAVLDISNRVQELLKAQGVSVRMTRDHDYFVPLSKRASLAKLWGADLFVSIHLNSAPNSGVSGIESYVCSSSGFASTTGGRADPRAYNGNRYDERNMLLAYYIHRSMLQSVPSIDRGIKRARFEVLRDAPCPAVLLECGFISNAAEATRILSRNHREALAKGIVAGIMSYVARTESKP